MSNYPQTLAEFERQFRSEAACREYLFRLRPEFQCKHCCHGKAWEMRSGKFECASCGYQASLTAGTIFQDSHQPLRIWFQAVWYVTNQKTGTSALGLQRALGLRSYQTAWTMLHKLRRAMVRPDRSKLKGRVEVDETFWGASEEAPGRGAQRKALIAIGAEEDGEGIGRIRLSRIPNASAVHLRGFVMNSIEAGSVVHTDGWNGYGDWLVPDYTHEVSILKGKKNVATELMPRVHRVASLLKRWLMGTHQGAVSHEHLDDYMDEFTFRFNRRTSRSRGLLFYRLLEQAVTTGSVPYKALVKDVRGNRKGGSNTTGSGCLRQ